MGLAAKLLKGADDDRLARSGLSATSTFGVLSEHSEEWILRLLRRCVTAGWIEFRGGDRPVVVLTDEGQQVMYEKRPARLLLPSLRSKTPASKGARPRRERGRGASAAAAEQPLDPADSELFERLRHHRLEVARAQSVPPYVVASDRTLRDVARRRPTDLAELQLAHGIGPAKAEKYGPGLLAVVAGPA
jgi:ATP-dependent DNA helicase RecQ